MAKHSKHQQKIVQNYYRNRDAIALQRLQEARVESLDLGFHLRDAREWWEILWGTAFRALLEQVPPGEQADFQRRHLERVDALKTDQGIWMELEVLVATGILGRFTTFSAFSLEAVTLYERGDAGQAALYVALSVCLSIAGLVAGLWVARAVFS